MRIDVRSRDWTEIADCRSDPHALLEFRERRLGRDAEILGLIAERTRIGRGRDDRESMGIQVMTTQSFFFDLSRRWIIEGAIRAGKGWIGRSTA